MSVDLNKKYWELLNKLDIVTIAAAGPRPGVDFVQSLFDNHPEVLTFDGWLLFDKFYDSAISLWGTENFVLGYDGRLKSKKDINYINPAHFFYEFAWKHLNKFDTRYETLEAKNKLGKSKTEYNKVDIDKFVDNALDLIGQKKLTRKNALLAIYGAYAITNGQKLASKKILIHQVHEVHYIPAILDDFSSLKIIACIRDPRVYGSQVVTLERAIPFSKSILGMPFSVLKQVIEDIDVMFKMKNVEIKANILENIHQNPEKTLRSMCDWLGIRFNSSLMQSTWNGKEWLGDSLSVDINETFNPKRYINSQIKWKKDLSSLDQLVIENLMRRQIKHYGYIRKYRNVLWIFLLPILILVPSKCEIRFLIRIMKTNKYTYILIWLIKLFQRYILMYKKLLKSIFKKDITAEYFGSW